MASRPNGYSKIGHQAERCAGRREAFLVKWGMRFPAAHPLRFFAVLCLASAIPGGVFADTIYLKSGRKITATHVTQENGR